MKQPIDNPDVSWVEIKRLWPFLGALILATAGWVSLKSDTAFMKEQMKEFSDYRVRNEARLGRDEINITQLFSQHPGIVPLR